MKTLFPVLLFFFCIATKGLAQQLAPSILEPSLKYGKPSNEELSMTTYAPDTTAGAVVLYKTTDANYEYLNRGFRVIYTHEVKIKVLKPEGTSYADVNIPYYDNEKNAGDKEAVTQIDASAYNMEGGKVVRTKMKKDFIFKERLNERYMQVKFSIPTVKAGTVFEYKYRVSSDFYYDLNDWEAQQDIPVLYGQCDVTIPEYFKFNLDMRGAERLEHKESSEPINFTVGAGGPSNTIHASGRHLTFIGRQLPALRSDGYIWCSDDYRSKVTFELLGLDFPGALYQTFTKSWEQIDEQILKDSEFGGMLKMRNPYRDEMSALGLDKLPTVYDKTAAIFTFLKKKISWNEQYNIYGNEVKKAIKNGTGSNAEINFVLISMLREANIPAYPVVMSRRDRGIIPYSYPSIQKINTFIVAIADTDSTYMFLDGSVKNGYLNVIPPVLMVNRARLVKEKGSEWVDLSSVGKNQIRSIVLATINPDGTISGTRTTGYEGQYASSFRNRYHAAKDSAEFISKLEEEESIRVTDFKTEQLNFFAPQVREAIKFEKQATVNDNFIYLNPILFLHVEKNPFIQDERKLPVELPYPEQITLSVSLTLPEGYTVDELPKPIVITTEDGQGKCRYNISQQGNRLATTYTFSSNKLLYLPSEYPGLKRFWETIAEKNNEMIVLKKL